MNTILSQPILGTQKYKLIPVLVKAEAKTMGCCHGSSTHVQDTDSDSDIDTIPMGASCEQIGKAAAFRDKMKDGSMYGGDRRDLNFVVHSVHPDPHFGKNRFRDPTCTFDPKAQKVLDAVRTSKRA